MNTARPWTTMPSAAAVGLKTFRATYTPRTWVLGWLVRLLSQSLFFASFGLWLGSRSAVAYMAVGNSILLACMESLAVISMIANDRYLGILPLHVAAPGSWAVSYFSRGLYCPVLGVLSGSLGFVVITGVFGVPRPWPASALVPVLLGVVSLSTYAFGCAVAAVVLQFPALQMVAINVGYLSIMTFCGVNVAVSFWPRPLADIAALLPLTHGLAAVRLLLAGAPGGLVTRDCLIELGVGLAWLIAGTGILRLAIYRGRKNGSLELTA